MTVPAWLTILSSTSRRLATAILDLAAFGLILMTAIIGWQVFGRYVLNASPAWSESLALLLMLYYVLLAAAVGVRQGFHLGLRLLIDNLPVAVRRWAVISGLVLVALFGALMAINGEQLIAYTADHVIPTLAISRSLAYWPFVLSGSLMVLFSVERIAFVFYGEFEVK